MNFLVIYPGRFQIFHKGHKASYDYLTKTFGENNVFVSTSDAQAPITSPFSFSDKVKMMTNTGISSGKIVQVKNPYRAQEITSQVDDPSDTVLIFALSEKDMRSDKPRFTFGTKKDGSPTYMQPWSDEKNGHEPMTKHAYVMVVPTVTFKVLDLDANSASELRKLYIESDDNTREQIITELYGYFDPTLKEIFDQRLNVTDNAEKLTQIAKDKNQIKNLTSEQHKRLFSNIQHILLAESKIRHSHKPLQEQLIKNYINEK